MKIKFLGAAGTVTGSSYALESDSGQAILIDLGMFQGLPAIETLNYQPFAYDTSRLSAVLLTHAHLDHCGRLPILLQGGFSGQVWMTPSTRDLTELSLLDTAKIAKSDKKPFLYDQKMVEEMLQHFVTTEYNHQFQIGDFSILYKNAGHLLGAASIEVIDKSAKSEFRKVVFSGDLGNPPESLLQEQELIDSADAVVLESTYGDRLHPNEVAIDQLQREINLVEKTGAALLIPSFSLERTQELLHLIKHLKADGKVQAQTPVFQDSPMAQKATKIYIQYPQICNKHIQEELRQSCPYEFPGLEVVFQREDSQAIHERSGPKVIVAGSGMMTGGRIVDHAAHYLPMPSTRLLFVGYQGDGTLGRTILEGAKEVMIEQLHVDIKATINTTHSMSSHADQAQLLKWLKHIQGVKKVFLTHGENVSRTALAAKIFEELGQKNVVMPKMGEQIIC